MTEVATAQETIDERLLDTYTPASLIHIFNNTFKSSAEKRQILLKGIFQGTGKRNYRGYYYDTLREEASQYELTVKINQVLRQQLASGQVYLFKGFLERTVKENGLIQLLFVVTELVGSEARQISDEDLRRVELLNQKVAAGFRDLDNFLRQRLFNGERPNIALIYGNTGIVAEDVMRAMRGYQGYYQLVEYRVNLADQRQIMELLAKINHAEYDVVAVVRGGGSGLEVFDDLELAEQVVQMWPMVVSAIGHAADQSLVDQVADKSFTTPTGLGEYLRELVDYVEEEKAQSKVKLLKELETEKEKQLIEMQQTLQKEYAVRLKELEIQNREKLTDQEVRVQEIQAKLKRGNITLTVLAILVVVSFVAGFLLHP